MSERVTVNFRLNGAPQRVTVPPMKRLLDVLREDCGLTGTKEGCGEGECGACTVLVDGLAVNSCLVPAAHAEGAKVVTVEGLAVRGRLSPLQQAFVDHGAAQCGMCTPGMLVTATAFLSASRGRVPSPDEVREGLAGTLCRCTGYQKIVDAVREAAGASRRVGAKPAAARRAAPKRTAKKRAANKRVAASSGAKKKAAKKRVAASRPAKTKAAPKRVAKKKAATSRSAKGAAKRVANRTAPKRAAARRGRGRR